MKIVSLALLFLLLVSGCSTTKRYTEPVRDPKDPSLTKLMLFLGRSRKDTLFAKMQKKYFLIQRKMGREGRYYPEDRAYSFWYDGDKIYKVDILVKTKSKILRPYTGALPFGLHRADSYESVVKKFGKPSSTLLDKSLLVYNEYKGKKVMLQFDDGTLSSVSLEVSRED